MGTESDNYQTWGIGARGHYVKRVPTVVAGSLLISGCSGFNFRTCSRDCPFIDLRCSLPCRRRHFVAVRAPLSFYGFSWLYPHPSLNVLGKPINTEPARSERCLWPLTEVNPSIHGASSHAEWGVRVKRLSYPKKAKYSFDLVVEGTTSWKCRKI